MSEKGTNYYHYRIKEEDLAQFLEYSDMINSYLKEHSPETHQLFVKFADCLSLKEIEDYFMQVKRIQQVIDKVNESIDAFGKKDKRAIMPMQETLKTIVNYTVRDIVFFIDKHKLAIADKKRLLKEIYSVLNRYFEKHQIKNFKEFSKNRRYAVVGHIAIGLDMLQSKSPLDNNEAIVNAVAYSLDN